MDNISFYKLLKNSLGFEYDSELKIIQTKYFQKINIDNDINLSEEQLTLFILLLCYMNNFTFLKFLSKLDFLQPFLIHQNTFKKQKIQKIHLPTFALDWTGNSCYIDSVLVSLFSEPNDFLTYNFFEKEIVYKEIQYELKNIYKRENVKKLRETFRNFKVSQRFHGTDTQDAGEFLQYLFTIFDITPNKQIRYTYISNDKNNFKLTSKIINDKSSPIILITLTGLNKDNTYNLCSFIKQKELAEFDNNNLFKYNGETYKYRLEITKYISPFIVFYIQRQNLDGSFNKIKMVPSPFLITPSYSKLSLSAIVIHTGGAHYVCVYKYDEIWYYYNDMSKNKIKEIGSFEQMLEIDKSPIKYGTLFFYK